MSHTPQKDSPNTLKEILGEINSHYQAIQIPENLKSQVEDSIRRAKQDPVTETMPARRRKRPCIPSWAKHFFAGAAAAILALAILANSSASIAHAMGQVPLLGILVDIITFRDYSIYNKNMKANLKIPKAQVTDSSGEALEEATEQLNNQIHSYTTKIIAAYLDDVKASGGEALESVDLDYEIAADNDKLFSLRFHKTLTMASAEQSEKIYHVDKETGKMATIKDLFQKDSNYKEVISQNIKEQMRAQMEADEEKTYYIADTPIDETARVPATPEGDGSTTYYFYTDGNPLSPRWDFSKDFKATPLEDGAAEGKTPSHETPSRESASEGNAAEDETAQGNAAENDTAERSDGFYEISDDVNFYVNESGKLMIVFDEYEVAPGFMGIISFEIPTDVLDGIVKDGYLK